MCKSLSTPKFFVLNYITADLVTVLILRTRVILNTDSKRLFAIFSVKRIIVV